MSRRLLIFSLVYYPRFIGGAEIAVKEITDRIQSDEIEFDMVTLHLDRSLPPQEQIGNVNVYRVGWPVPLTVNKYLFPFLAWFKAGSLERQKRYDGIWALMANYAGFGALFFKLTHPRLPFLLTLQEGDPIPYIKKRVGIFYPLFKKIFTRADRVQAISNYLGDFARDMGFQGPLEIIPNAVDTKHFSARAYPRELEALKQELEKGREDLFLITTSRLVVKNAVGDVIKALKFLPPNIKFLILGTGQQLKMLQALVDKHGLRSRVKFLGYITHEAMPKYLQISDIFIRPALSEGFGNSFIEAMAAGLPVIATPVGGIPDFLKDGETGVFCRVDDPQSITEQVMRLLRDEPLKKRIVDQARRMVFDRYDWNLIASQMKSLFLRLVP